MPGQENQRGIAVVLDFLPEWRSYLHLVDLQSVALAHETHKLELQSLEFGEKLLLRKISSRHERRCGFHSSDSLSPNSGKRADHFPKKPAEQIAPVIAVLLAWQGAGLFDRFYNARDVRLARQIEMSDTFTSRPPQWIIAPAPPIIGNEIAQAIESRLGVFQLRNQ